MVRSRRLRLALRILALLTPVAVVLGGIVLALEAFGAEQALTRASASVRDARQALADGDLDAAERHIAAARGNADTARSRTDGPVWWTASQVPFLGRSPDILRAVVAVADAAVSVGEAALARGDDLLDEDGDLPLRFVDGAIDLDALRTAADAFDTLPLAALDGALADLRHTRTTLVPGIVGDARREVLDEVASVQRSLVKAGEALDVLPAFLGDDEPRRYLLALQNPAELRGTGGLVSLYGILRADGGRLTLDNVRDSSDLVPPGGGYEPVPAPEGFHERYQHAWADSYVINTNVDPDLPTVAQVMLALHAEHRGQQLDGVVAIDTVAMGDILAPIGPVVLDDPAGGSVSIPPGDLPQVTLVDAYERFEGDSEARTTFLAAVADAAFASLLQGGWDTVAVTRATSKTVGERNLQLHSTRDDEQAAFERLGVAGRLAPSAHEVSGAAAAPDLLALVANNTGGNKMDVHVGHELHLAVDLEVDGAAAASGSATVPARRGVHATVALDNPLPTSGMAEAIIGNIPTSPAIPNDYFGPPGLNRTWFTLWASGATELTSAADADGEPLDVGAGSLHGLRAFDHYLETPSRARKGFELDLLGTAELDRDGGDLVYRLLLRRQAKAIPDLVEIEVAAPDGWDIAGARTLGGGDGTGMGVHGTGVPLEIRHDATTVHVGGTVTADLIVEVRLTRGVWPRFVDWFRAPL